jgi:hypothetical protein
LTLLRNEEGVARCEAGNGKRDLNSGLATINLVVRSSYTQNSLSAKDKDRDKRGNRGRAQERRKEERFVSSITQLFGTGVLKGANEPGIG